MARKPSNMHIAGGVDQLTAAAITAAIAQQLKDEETTAAKPKESRKLSKWTKQASEEPTFLVPRHPNQ